MNKQMQANLQGRERSERLWMRDGTPSSALCGGEGEKSLIFLAFTLTSTIQN